MVAIRVCREGKDRSVPKAKTPWVAAVEKTSFLGLVEVLREEGLDGVRYTL